MSIILDNVQKSYGENIVFSDFSYEFENGKTYCVMGSSGCGKTTLLHIILGLVSPDSGIVSGVSERLSAVFQEDRLCEDITAYGNVFAAVNKRVTRKDIESCFSRLGLIECMDKKVSELSGGMKRRVAIARALLAESTLVVLDEPFKGLDVETRKNTIQTVLDYTKNKTVIFATHDICEAELMGAEIICIE